MIKHPLVQKEWKYIRWMMLLFMAIFTFFAVALNNNIHYDKTSHLLREHSSTIFMDLIYRMGALMIPMVLVGVLILVIILFAHERNFYVGKFISSLPFTRREQFTIKYSMGMIAYTPPLLIFGIAAYVIRINHGNWIARVYKYLPYGDILTKEDRVGALFLWLCITWLIITAIYSFLMMIQTLMGQNIIGGIVGAIIVFVPWFFSLAIPTNLELLNVYRIRYPDWMRRAFEFFFFAKPQWSQEQVEIVHKIDGIWWYSVNSYRDLPLCILILIVIIIISTILAYRFIEHNDVEKNGDIVMYNWVGRILVLGITVCSLLLLPMIVVIFTQIENVIITLISMIIGSVLGYIISTKSIELTRRHG